jgi:WD40 repeat protein
LPTNASHTNSAGRREPNAQRPRAQDDERSRVARARLNGGCLLTFWVQEGNFYAHHNTVNQVTWSYDEKRVASCSNDKSVRIWEPRTGRLVRTLEGHEYAVMGVTFSEDGLRLVRRVVASSSGVCVCVCVFAASTAARRVRPRRSRARSQRRPPRAAASSFSLAALTNASRIARAAATSMGIIPPAAGWTTC